MKIQGSDPRIIRDNRVKEAKEEASSSRKRSTTSGSEGAGGSEKVLLSDEAKDIHKAREVIASDPEIRMDKVAEIKAKIESGDYHVDSKEIADKMLKDILIE